jgi:signal transduction histidine kinase
VTEDTGRTPPSERRDPAAPDGAAAGPFPDPPATLGRPATRDRLAPLGRMARLGWNRLWPLVTEVMTTKVEPQNPRRRRLLGIDLVVAFDLVLTAIVFGTGYSQLTDVNAAASVPGDGLAVLIVSIMLAVPATLRERWPTVAWATSLLGGLWAASMVAPFQAGGVIVFLYTLYTVAARASNRRAVGTTWAISALSAAIAYPPGLPVSAILITIPMVVGISVYSRELHDVVAHHMSVIAIQAEAAPYRVADPPPELTESFAGIRASALDGLTELRRILGVLRAEDTERDTAPQPGLERLDELVTTARAAGHAVETETTGRPRALPPAMELSAYRILQEAVSNVLRHAPGAPIRVRIDYGEADESGLRISVVNGPAATPAPSARQGSGHGLAGMRERTALLGGELTAAATAEGGYAVEVDLPAAKVIVGDGGSG